MLKTPSNKYTSFSTQKQTCRRKYDSQYYIMNAYNKSMTLYSKKQNDNTSKMANTLSIKQQANQVLKELSSSYIYAICQDFENVMSECIDHMAKSFLIIQHKIAELQRKFNAIQLSLHKKSKQISVVLSENTTLIALNRDIQMRIQQLKQKYQLSQAVIKKQWLGAKVDSFRNQLVQMHINDRKNQANLKNNRQRFVKQVSKLENLYKKQNNFPQIFATIKQIINILYQTENLEQNTLMKTWKEKIMQNIDLKFQVINLKQQIKNLQLSKQSKSLGQHIKKASI